MNYLHCLLRRYHSDSHHTHSCIHSNSKGKPGKDIHMLLTHNHMVRYNHTVGLHIHSHNHIHIHNHSHKAEHIHSHNSAGIHSNKVVHRCKGIHE